VKLDQRLARVGCWMELLQKESKAQERDEVDLKSRQQLKRCRGRFHLPNDLSLAMLEPKSSVLDSFPMPL
jgi:hypothetical protein